MAVIGLDALMDLAVGVSVIRHFAHIPATVLDVGAFWRHSVGCGLAARLLSSHSGQPSGRGHERVFLGGLLHDLGRMVMLHCEPALCRLTLERARAGQGPASELEREVWGFNHCVLAGLVMEAWRFPDPLRDMVVAHHSPPDGPEGVEASLLHVADIVCHCLGLGESGAFAAPPLDPAAWDALNLDKSTLSLIHVQLEHQLDELCAVFLG